MCPCISEAIENLTEGKNECYFSEIHGLSTGQFSYNPMALSSYTIYPDARKTKGQCHFTYNHSTLSIHVCTFPRTIKEIIHTIQILHFHFKFHFTVILKSSKLK